MAKKVFYSVEIEACDEIVFDDIISKKTFEHYIKRLNAQVQETKNQETPTELVNKTTMQTEFRIVEEWVYLRTTTFISLKKTTMKLR